MIDCDGFISPAPRRPLHDREARFRCHKGADSGAAVREQQAARLQSASQFAEQMGLMRQQYEDSKKVKTPKYASASPAAAGNSDVYTAGLEMRRRMSRRFGSAATNLVPFPSLGGAVPMAA